MCNFQASGKSDDAEADPSYDEGIHILVLYINDSNLCVDYKNSQACTKALPFYLSFRVC